MCPSSNLEMKNSNMEISQRKWGNKMHLHHWFSLFKKEQRAHADCQCSWGHSWASWLQAETWASHRSSSCCTLPLKPWCIGSSALCVPTACPGQSWAWLGEDTLHFPKAFSDDQCQLSMSILGQWDDPKIWGEVHPASPGHQDPSETVQQIGHSTSPRTREALGRHSQAPGVSPRRKSCPGCIYGCVTELCSPKAITGHILSVGASTNDRCCHVAPAGWVRIRSLSEGITGGLGRAFWSQSELISEDKLPLTALLWRGWVCMKISQKGSKFGLLMVTFV